MTAINRINSLNIQNNQRQLGFGIRFTLSKECVGDIECEMKMFGKGYNEHNMYGRLAEALEQHNAHEKLHIDNPGVAQITEISIAHYPSWVNCGGGNFTDVFSGSIKAVDKQTGKTIKSENIVVHLCESFQTAVRKLHADLIHARAGDPPEIKNETKNVSTHFSALRRLAKLKG